MTFIPGPTLVLLWLIGSAGAALTLASLTLPRRRGGDNLDMFDPTWRRAAALFVVLQLAAAAALAALLP